MLIFLLKIPVCHKQPNIHTETIVRKYVALLEQARPIIKIMSFCGIVLPILHRKRTTCRSKEIKKTKKLFSQRTGIDLQ